MLVEYHLREVDHKPVLAFGAARTLTSAGQWTLRPLCTAVW